jgi:hypothetical protein
MSNCIRNGWGSNPGLIYLNICTARLHVDIYTTVVLAFFAPDGDGRVLKVFVFMKKQFESWSCNSRGSNPGLSLKIPRIQLNWGALC